MLRHRPQKNIYEPILAAFGVAVQPHQVEYLIGAGGFSGAEFWRLKTASGALCLRRWPPEHPSAQRLTLIHQVLRHAAEQGIEFLPVPLATSDGRTFVSHEGHFWELAPWLAGEGNFSHDSRPAKLRAALVALARFHEATADFPSAECRLDTSPGIAARLEQVRGWTASELSRLRSAIAGDAMAQQIVSLYEQLAPRVASELSIAATLTTWLQPVIRDVWSDHFLFTGDEVTGLVDFGGLNIDTPATDIARLLGSLAGDDPDAWQTGIAAYETIRRMPETERRLIPAFDRSTVTLAGMNWMRWMYLEQRTFADTTAVEARLSTIAQRMRFAASDLSRVATLAASRQQ